MSIIPQNQDDLNLVNAIESFISEFRIGRLLDRCNARKEKGIPVMQVFRYKLCNVFNGMSMYMQQRTNSFRESFSKNTYYRFLNGTKTNWQRFTTLLSADIINKKLRDLTAEDRVNAFVIDDSLHERQGYKRTELASSVFDHSDMKYKKGYRLMTLGWTDGNTFMPINSCLLASSKDENIKGTTKVFDKRSVAGRRRAQARRKGTDVMLELLRTACSAGHSAEYVLFDSWFANPHQIVSIKDMDLDVIAMVKKSSRIHYQFEGESLSIKQIFSRCKKRRGRSRYLLSVDVMVGKNDGESEHPIPAKIVCVRNKKNRNDWIALICTNTDLSEEEIIRVYGKRWSIEVFFKTCKSRLNLVKECHSLSYDALTAHAAIVFTRYMMIALEQRRNEDQRTLGELFCYFVAELSDITFSRSLQILFDALMESLLSVLKLTEEQISAFMNDFVGRLPDYMQKALLPEPSAA